jgi:hypothetical protein
MTVVSILSIGHWESKFVCYLILPSSFLKKKYSFSTKKRKINKQLVCQ